VVFVDVIDNLAGVGGCPHKKKKKLKSFFVNDSKKVQKDTRCQNSKRV